MAYIELEDLRGELDIDGTGDNPLLQQAIQAAQTYIESQTNRRFEAAAGTRYYTRDALDAGDRYLLHIDGELQTVTTLANGDGRDDTYTADHTTEQLTLATASVYDELETGTPAMVYSTNDDPPAGLAEGTVYYTILVASPVIQLATTRALALAGTEVALTDNGTGTQTIVFGGSIIPRDHYLLEPRNYGPPYHGIRLKTSESDYWQWNEDCYVTVAGTWGYAASVPYDIRRACTILAAYFYRQKDAQQFETTAIVESGAIAIPQGIPATVDRILARYKRYL